MTKTIQTMTPSGGGDFKPYCVTGSGVALTTSSETTLDLSTEVIANANYSLDTDQITVTAAGTYQISYNVIYENIDASGATRGGATTHMDVDTVDIPQSFSASYIREASGDQGSSTSFIVELDASDVLRLRTIQDFAHVNIQQGITQISILKVA